MRNLITIKYANLHLSGIFISFCLMACMVPPGEHERTGKVSELNCLPHVYDLGHDVEDFSYDVVSVDETGTESPYATMELHTKKDGTALFMNDTITLIPQYHSMKFERKLTYKENDLLHPIDVTLDISAESHSNREMSYSNGVLSVYEHEPVTVDFSQGILVYNAMLRFVRLLDMNQPHRYSFQKYAEPFLFRIHEANEDEKFYLESIPVSGTEPFLAHTGLYIRVQMGPQKTEIWVDKDRKPIRMIEHLKENRFVVFKLRRSEGNKGC